MNKSWTSLGFGLTASGWVGGATAYLGSATAYLVGVLDGIKAISAQMDKSWTSCKQVMNKSWTSREQVMNKSWTRYVKIINKSKLMFHEQVMSSDEQYKTTKA